MNMSPNDPRRKRAYAKRGPRPGRTYSQKARDAERIAARGFHVDDVVTAAELAAQFAVTTETVRNWRVGYLIPGGTDRREPILDADDWFRVGAVHYYLVSAIPKLEAWYKRARILGPRFLYTSRSGRSYGEC